MGFPGGEPPPLPLPTLVKLGRAITEQHVDRILAALLRRRRHRLVGALASQALANSLRPTARTHLLAASALLDSDLPHDAARRLALAGPPPSSRRLWDALLRRACAQRGNPRLALELLSAGVEDHGAVLSPSTYGVIISELCARGDMAGALKVFDIMTARGCQVDDRVCSVIISGFSKASKVEAGLEFYDRVRKEVRGFEPGLVTLTAVVNLLGRQGRIGDVAELIREMEQKDMVGDAMFYSSLVHGYMSSGLLMEGFREHRLMLDKGVAADVVNYTIVIDGMCREGSVEKVKGFIDEMERRGAKPNLITYTSLVGGFCKRNRLADAFSIVRKLEQTGVVVDEYVYSILIDSLCKRGDLDKAISLLGEMEGKGVKAGTVTYNAVINGLCKAGETTKAVEMSEGVTADNFTYSTLLHGYIKQEDTTGVVAIKARLESSGIALDVVTCNVLIKALFVINKVDDACSLFHRMRDMGLSPNTVTYHTLINMMCKLGDFDRAVELFDEYRKDTSFSSTVVHNGLIGALCNGGKVTIADQVFYDLIHKKLRPDSCTYRKLIHANFKEGGEQGVLNFIHKMEELEMDLFSSVCNYASDFLSSRDCCQAALYVYKILRTQAFAVSSKTFYRLLKSLLRNGNEQVIEPLLSDFIKIHGLHEPRMINMLSCHLSKKGVGEAIRFSSNMNSGSIPISVLRGAVFALKKEGEIMDAYNFLKEAEQSGFSVDLAMYSIVVEGLCKGGYLEKALDLCESMKIEGIHPTIIIHNSVLSGLCQHGCFTEAFRLFDYLERSNIPPTMITYTILICALCREGFLDDAYELFQKMSSKVISGHCMKGDTEAALGFFNEYHCKEMVPDFVGFMSLVKGLYAKGRMEESRGILREMFQSKQVVELINNVGYEVETESLVALLSSACEEGKIDEVVTILSEVRLMSVSSSDSNISNTLGQFKKLKRTDDACDPRTDSEQVLSSADFDVSSNCLHGSSRGTLQPMTERTDSLCTTTDNTDIDNGNLLGKSFYDDFDTYYPAIASLCSKGELVKANKAIEAMIQNSG
ncbi:unnamed protein product [Triticum turgidum subsp. durum]|uniref:Pentatricopeptide repeat-containing protein n=1 Tax=Triticum turgidum subsp. durum TaxID=4567 RepID=A0A9R0RHE7_TRITD|nr:unnamed protein product [Triticum turgidum subsp. durum]